MSAVYDRYNFSVEYGYGGVRVLKMAFQKISGLFRKFLIFRIN